jgi:predicted Zn finger-like uncharacterized protein
MILNCTDCGTRYLIDPAALGAAGRTVRCAKCGHSWFQAPQKRARYVEVAPPPQATQPLPQGSNLPAFPRAPAPQKRSRAGAWILAVLFPVLVGLGLYAGRESIVEIWPPARQLYAALGAPEELPGVGLEVRNIATRRVVEGNIAFLVVAGEITNPSSSVRPVPNLRGTLRDAQNNELRNWDFSGNSSRLLPGQSATFETRIENPPAAAANLDIRFVPRP